jgi:hypothetical protein
MAVTRARSPLDAAIDALVGGHHRDPFSLLGPHVDDDGTPVVRAFQPAAQSIDLRLVATGALVPMAKVHVAGMYEVRLKADATYEKRADAPHEKGEDAPHEKERGRSARKARQL